MKQKQTFLLRNALQKNLRFFFEEHDYIEVETPIAVRSPGTEIHLDYFKTTWQDYQKSNHPLWLRSSPEIHMKQLLKEDFSGIFQIAKCFRNLGECSLWHHPEFTMLEWYKKEITFQDYILETENLLH